MSALHASDDVRSVRKSTTIQPSQFFCIFFLPAASFIYAIFIDVSVLMLTVASYTLSFIVCCIIYITQVNILYYFLHCLCFVPFIVTHSCMTATFTCWQHGMYNIPNIGLILLKPQIRIRNVLILNYLCIDILFIYSVSCI